MQYRKFGKLDWKVSALGFGCMRLPTLEGKNGVIDLELTTRMIRRAIEGGVNYFDTAYVYHEQQSEVALGIALEGGYRQKVRIATKLPVWQLNEAADLDRMLDEELKRLQTDTIDFYLLHSLERERWHKVQALDLFKRAEAAIADGRIRYLGFSFHDKLEVFKEIIDGYDRWDFCQMQYNYLDTDFQAGTLGLKYAADKGLGVVVMEPLRGGNLALDLPVAKPIWASAAHQRTPADWALQWVWSQPEVSVALSGMSAMAQVEENLASADESRVGLLNGEELKMIDKVGQAVKGLSPIPCTRCEYCLPCPNGVNIPLNFDMYNKVGMFGNLEHYKVEYKQWIKDDQKASCCIQCNDCLPKCPQNIDISSWMPVVDEVLGEGKPYVREV
jgi:predicted aldo/keto reductase-like oxidoreductase